MTRNRKSYAEMATFQSFQERYDYLKLGGRVGFETFGPARYINQRFYTSTLWKNVRNQVVVRDEGCDLGVPGRDIRDRIYIHHINPLTVEAIQNGDYSLIDPENLVCVTHHTHNALHYGDEKMFEVGFSDRRPGDTKLW